MRTSTPLILALDTSTRAISIALSGESEVFFEQTWTSADYHTVELAPNVAKIFNQDSYRLSDVIAIAIASGPGSFTGLRIGMALAKGLAFALHIPMIGVNTLDILAVAHPAAELPLAVVLRAGRGRYAVNLYRNESSQWKPMSQEAVITIEQFPLMFREPTIICGELSFEERTYLAEKAGTCFITTPAHSLRRASFLAEIGWARWKNHQLDDPLTLSPHYLHYHDPIPG